MNKKIMEAMGFGDMMRLVANDQCPFCGKQVKMEDFRSELARREFKISGICQKCQDETFSS